VIFESNVNNNVQLNDSLMYLSRLSLAQGEIEDANEYIDRALKVEPTTSDEVALHAHLLCESAQSSSMFKALKLAKKCIARYEEAVALDDTNLNALMPAMGFHMEAPGIAGGDKEKGQAYLERLSEVSLEHAQTYQVNRLKNDGEIEKAMELLII
jgi:tetratricopeptide (TPR) repeat protein